MLRPSPINLLPFSAKGGKPLADVDEASSLRVGPFPRFGGEGSTSGGSSTSRPIWHAGSRPQGSKATLAPADDRRRGGAFLKPTNLERYGPGAAARIQSGVTPLLRGCCR